MVGVTILSQSTHHSVSQINMDYFSLCRELMTQHGLGPEWKVKSLNSKKKRGHCKSKAKVIGLSKHLLANDSEESVRNTILHEIAHALTPGHHHDAVWKAKALSIGCNGKRCGDQIQNIQTKYGAKCGQGCEFKYCHQPKKLDRKRCRKHKLTLTLEVFY